MSKKYDWFEGEAHPEFLPQPKTCGECRRCEAWDAIHGYCSPPFLMSSPDRRLYSVRLSADASSCECFEWMRLVCEGSPSALGPEARAKHDAKMQEASRLIDSMEEWQRKHGLKYPD